MSVLLVWTKTKDICWKIKVCRGICVSTAEAVTNFLWHLAIIHAALLVRFTYGFVCYAKNARCTKHTCSPHCRCLLALLQQAVMTASAAKQQHTDDTCGYETVDTILLSICAEDIRLPFSKSRIAYGNFCSIYLRRGGISFCSDDSKHFVMSAALVTAPSQCLSAASFGECRP